MSPQAAPSLSPDRNSRGTSFSTFVTCSDDAEAEGAGAAQTRYLGEERDEYDEDEETLEDEQIEDGHVTIDWKKLTPPLPPPLPVSLLSASERRNSAVSPGGSGGRGGGEPSDTADAPLGLNAGPGVGGGGGGGGGESNMRVSARLSPQAGDMCVATAHGRACVRSCMCSIHGYASSHGYADMLYAAHA
jgi:hypothetical protein